MYKQQKANLLIASNYRIANIRWQATSNKTSSKQLTNSKYQVANIHKQQIANEK